MGERSFQSFLVIVLMAFTLLLAVQGGSAFQFVNRVRSQLKAHHEHPRRTPTRRLLTTRTPPRPDYAECPPGTMEGYTVIRPVDLFFCQDCLTSISNHVTVTKRTSGVPWPADTDYEPPILYTNRKGAYQSCAITRCPQGMTLEVESPQNQYWLHEVAANSCKGTLPDRINSMNDDDTKYMEVDNLCQNMLGTTLANADYTYASEPGNYSCFLRAFPTYYPICKTSNSKQLKEQLSLLNGTRPVYDGVTESSDREILNDKCSWYRSLPGFDSTETSRSRNH